MALYEFRIVVDAYDGCHRPLTATTVYQVLCPVRYLHDLRRFLLVAFSRTGVPTTKKLSRQSVADYNSHNPLSRDDAWYMHSEPPTKFSYSNLTVNPQQMARIRKYIQWV